MNPPVNSDEMDFKQSLFACYANIAITEMKLYNSESDFMRPTHKEILYMYSIWTNPGCTASDLVELFNSSKALVSQTIIAMEEKGYIIRTKDPKDNRRQILEISPQRLEATNKELQLIDAATTALSRDYSKEEIANAAKIIHKFTQHMMDIAIDQTTKKKG
jgi:DNA-binding MarR family transcriptional regulator